MELLPEAAREGLPPIGAQEDKLPSEVMVYLCYRQPGGWSWYVIEGEATGGEEENEVPDFMFFGFVKGAAQEYGTFMLSDLEGWPTLNGMGVERDLTFQPVRLATLAEPEGLEVYLGEEE